MFLALEIKKKIKYHLPENSDHYLTTYGYNQGILFYST